jgi:hypothetical protein
MYVSICYQIVKTNTPYDRKNKRLSSRTKRRFSRYSSREVNGMDVIDLCKHWIFNFNEGNILKYLLRDKAKHMGKIIDFASREKIT